MTIVEPTHGLWWEWNGNWALVDIYVSEGVLFKVYQTRPGGPHREPVLWWGPVHALS